MKNWTKKYIALLASCVFLLINACTTTDPIPYKNNDMIDGALKEGLRDNRSLKNSRTNNGLLSPAIQNALMPEININLPNTDPNNEAQGDEQEQRFDIAVNNIPARDFFMGLVKDTKYNITISPLITGNISLELKSITVPQAMDAVRDTYGFEYEKTSYGYQVFPRRLETRVFNINYLDIDRTGHSQVTIGSGQITNTVQNTLTASGVSTQQQPNSAPSGIINTTSTSKFWELLKQNLETIIGTQDGRSIIVNARSGVIIVRAYPNELRYVAQYLDKIQSIIHRQVIIEAKVLEVQLGAQFQSGINWSILGLTQGFNQTRVITSSITGTTSSSDNNQTNTNGTKNLPLFTGALNLQANDGGVFKTVINLLNTQGKVNTLSSPRIATINNQKAVIKVGEDDFFVTNVSSNTNNSSSTNTNTTANITLTPFFSGISLDVTPQIDEDDNVTMHIHPIISKVTKKDQQITVNNQLQDLPLASSTVRESDSIVRAKNGQVIVIGGLMISDSRNYQSSTPGTEHLPGISGLFKNKNKEAAKFELVILLQPRIAETTGAWQQQLKKVALEVKNMKGDFSYNVVPEKSKPQTNQVKKCAPHMQPQIKSKKSDRVFCPENKCDSYSGTNMRRNP